jgi:YggT family protein
MVVMGPLRWAVFAVVALTALVALLCMVVQRRLINPFGRPARAIRDLTDPVIKPIERRLLRAGGNPQSAPWWLLGAAIVGGILVITLSEWLLAQVQVAQAAASMGGRTLLAVVLNWALGLLSIALVVRVVGSWIGASQFTPWMRPFWLATEWLLRPIRRVLPPLGPFDLSPLVAWVLISWIIRPMILQLV